MLLACSLSLLNHFALWSVHFSLLRENIATRRVFGWGAPHAHLLSLGHVWAVKQRFDAWGQVVRVLGTHSGHGRRIERASKEGCWPARACWEIRSGWRGNQAAARFAVKPFVPADASRGFVTTHRRVVRVNGAHQAGPGNLQRSALYPRTSVGDKLYFHSGRILRVNKLVKHLSNFDFN